MDKATVGDDKKGYFEKCNIALESYDKHLAQIKELREALQGIIEIGKRDMTNPKYDGYFETAKQALKSTEEV